MRAYPLIKRRWSNEHIMAALFIVLLLYLIPRWFMKPAEIPGFIAILALALVIDAVAGYIRYKRVICGVSAAVTAAILQILTPGIPLWGRLIAISAAIILGKHVWGGPGKNTLNPAITGYFIICLLFTVDFTPIPQTAFIIPALILSLPFILFRPYASLGFIAGMLVSMFMPGHNNGFSMFIICIFLGSIIITDPVTVTSSKLVGLLGSLIVGFLPLRTGNSALSFAMLLLIFNLISYLLEDFKLGSVKPSTYAPLTVKKLFATEYSGDAPDLTRTAAPKSEEPGEARELEEKFAAEDEVEALDKMTPQMILQKISDHHVYGMGGAAFPTADKIQAVLSSGAEKKYFIINGVECDPGLIHDKWLLRNRTEDIQKGIRIISRCVDFSDVILALKETEGSLLSLDLKISRVHDFYPAGFERILIEELLKKKLPAGSIPAKEGILILNIQTVLSVYEAVCLDKQAVEKYITVADIPSGRARPVRVKIGTDIEKVLKTVYPSVKTPVYAGGGIMQTHLTQDTDLVENTTNFIAAAEMPQYKESPYCSKCGECTAHCPQNLQVQKIASLVDADKYQEASAYSPDKCMQCGICSYVCLAGRNLSARVTEAQNWMRNNTDSKADEENKAAEGTAI